MINIENEDTGVLATGLRRIGQGDVEKMRIGGRVRGCRVRAAVGGKAHGDSRANKSKEQGYTHGDQAGGVFG
jgi:hypothetical protein